MPEAFMGVEAELLTALGKVVVATGRVELVLALVAKEVGVPNPTDSASKVIKEIRKACRALPKPMADLRQVILDWTSTLPDLFDFRNESIHGVHMRTLAPNGSFDPIVRLLRRDESKPIRVEELEATAEQLAVLYTEGMNLFGALHIANLDAGKRSGNADVKAPSSNAGGNGSKEPQRP